jgi:hypothetical protein
MDWIKQGMVVTQSRYDEAVKAGLSKSAMSRIWVKNTLTKKDVEIINKKQLTKKKKTKKDGV